MNLHYTFDANKVKLESSDDDILETIQKLVTMLEDCSRESLSISNFEN